MKRPSKKIINPQGLKQAFAFFNAQFFSNRIPGSLNVVFMKNCGYKSKGKWIPADGYFDHATDSIVIDEGLKEFPDFTAITLLHEMVHADLRFRGHVGYPVDNGHGTTFHGEITRLIKAGAYDGLL